MIPSDPSFGAGFDADEFRDAIRQTMMMGMPSAVEERVTFKWTPTKTYAVSDNAGDPYDWTSATVTDDTASLPDKVVTVACEFVSRASLSDGTPIGPIETPKVILTLLDVDYVEVEGASHVGINGKIYRVDYTAPPIGLFDVTVYQIYCTMDAI